MAEQISVVIDSAPVAVAALDLSMDVAITVPDAPGQGGMVVLDAVPLIVAMQPPNAAQVNAIYLPAAPVSTGSSAGDDMPTAKRTDFVSDAVFYRGEAVAGAAESAAVWRISRVTLGGDGDTTEEWANGSADFACAWSDRLTLEYR